MGYKLVKIPGLEEPLKFDDRIPDGAINAMIRRDWGDHIAKYKEFNKYMGRPGEMESLMLGAGDTMKGLELGIRENLGQDVTQQKADRMAVRGHVTDKPNLFGLGQTIPYFGIPAGAASRPVGAALKAAQFPKLGAAVGGSAVADAGIQGALLGAADVDMTAGEGALWGAGGAATAKLGLGLLKPSDKVVRGDRGEAIKRGLGLGYELTPAQTNDSKILQMIEKGMESNPITGGSLLNISAKNQANSNRIVAKALGFDGKDAITPKMLDDVAEDFSKGFGEINAKGNIELGEDFFESLVKLESENTEYWIRNKDFKKVIHSALDDAAEGYVTPEKYKTLSSKLSQEIRGQYKPGGKPEFAQQLIALKESLDDAMEATLGSTERASMQKLRADYRTYANLMKNHVINEDTGDVSLRQLGNILRKEDRYGYRRGHDKSDLYEATRFTRAFPDAFGNSGTAQRSALPALAGMSALGGMAGYASDGEGSPLGAAAGLLAAPGAMWALSKGYASPVGREYINKGILPGLTKKITPEIRNLLAQKMGLLSIASQ